MVELASGDTWVMLDPARGGAIAGYYSRGPAGSVDWLVPADSLRPACFPLLPFASRIRNGEFRFSGQTVQLPANNPPEQHAIHGQAWQQPWVVTRQSAHHASCEFHHPPGAWPWRYVARQKFTLEDRTLRINLELENLSSTIMPAGMGLHPYFPRTPRTQIYAGVTSRWQLGADLLRVGSAPVAHETPDDNRLLTGAGPIDAVFSGWVRQALIELPECKAQIAIAALAPLQHLVVYSEEAADYVCVEPVSNVVDAFNLNPTTDPGNLYQVIASGDCLQTEVMISPRFV